MNIMNDHDSADALVRHVDEVCCLKRTMMLVLTLVVIITMIMVMMIMMDNITDTLVCR